MPVFEQEQESEIRRRSFESAEVEAENKEKGNEDLEKKMGAKERVEKVSHEVRNTQQQIQHIMANMQQVLKAVQAIRVQLGLAGGSVPSVERDEKTLEQLKKKLTGLNSQLADLRVALEQEEARSVKEDRPDWNADAIAEEAKKITAKILLDLGLKE